VRRYEETATAIATATALGARYRFQACFSGGHRLTFEGDEHVLQMIRRAMDQDVAYVDLPDGPEGRLWLALRHLQTLEMERLPDSHFGE
jgi:hypothetical protein